MKRSALTDLHELWDCYQLIQEDIKNHNIKSTKSVLEEQYDRMFQFREICEAQDVNYHHVSQVFSTESWEDISKDPQYFGINIQSEK